MLARLANRSLAALLLGMTALAVRQQQQIGRLQSERAALVEKASQARYQMEEIQRLTSELKAFENAPPGDRRELTLTGAPPTKSGPPEPVNAGASDE